MRGTRGTMKANNEVIGVSVKKGVTVININICRNAEYAYEY